MSGFRADRCHLREAHVATGENVDCFYSFFPFRGRLHSVHRRFQLTTGLGSDSTIVHTEYAGGWSDGIAAERAIGRGVDPRAAADDDRAYALFCAFPGDPNRYYVHDFRTDELIPTPNITGHPYIGKNWQPFIWQGELHAVQEFNPVRVVRFDVPTKQVRVIAELASNLHLRALTTNTAPSAAAAMPLNWTAACWGSATSRNDRGIISRSLRQAIYSGWIRGRPDRA